jgi:polygalacturonase
VIKYLIYCTLTIINILICSFENNAQIQKNNDPWDIVVQIKDSVGEITFPNIQYNVMDYSAKPDGVTNNSGAFKNAIEDCYQKGGGIVVVPPGKYFSGPIHLKDNVNFHLNEGAEILFSTNPDDYYPLVHTSFEGTEMMNYSPLVYAYHCKNVGITGKGILNGMANSTNWWPWKGNINYGWKKGLPNQNDENNRPKLEQMAIDNIPIDQRIFGNDHYLRPSFIEPFACSNVIIKGIKIVNAPFWVIHPMKCKNVMIDSVTVESHGPNNDGCDPEYSKNVIIKNTSFNTGDDCIAIKSGRDADGRRVGIKSENIVIQNCKMIDGHAGVAIGSEISAGVCNVFAENCVMSSPELDRAIRIKTNTKRGGIIENVYVRNIEVGTIKECLMNLNMFYNSYGNQTGNYIPIIRNINLENIKVKNGGKYGIWAIGLKDSPIQNVKLKNVIIEKVEKAYSIENIKDFSFIETYMNGKLLENP